MSTYRLNLTIDEDFAKILRFFKSQFPLLSDIEIIKMLIGEKYVEKLTSQKSSTSQTQSSLTSWIDSLPQLNLNQTESEELDQNLQQSSTSGFSPWNKEEFINEILN